MEYLWILTEKHVFCSKNTHFVVSRVGIDRSTDKNGGESVWYFKTGAGIDDRLRWIVEWLYTL